MLINKLLVLSIYFFAFCCIPLTFCQSDCDEGNDDGGHGCPPGVSTPKPPPPCSACFPVVHAFDPNDIVGPTGYDTPQWMAGKDQFQYMIRFENDPDFATAPAQKVTIRMPVDSQMNVFSFQLGEFGFGSYRYTVPNNSSFYSDRLTNTADSLNVFVDVTAGIDVTKNEAFWIFESVDPVTGLVPEDALTGFLPVNDTTINRFNDTITKPGEGFVTFLLKPKLIVQTGDSVTHKASIVFDINAPIPTNTWSNILDAKPPSSRVLPAASLTPSNSIRLQFAGEDDPGGVGIAHYDLYITKDNGSFFLHQAQIDTNYFWFTGEAGSQYQFYTRATDHVGNQEEPKFEKETSTTLGVENYIIVESPGAGDQFCPGDTIPISWASVNAGNGFDLAISLDGGSQFIPIVENIDSLASPYLYGLSTSIPTTEVAIIQIKNHENGEIIGNSNPFTIWLKPIVDLGPNIRLEIGGTAELMPTVEDESLSYLWSTGETTSSITVSELNRYTLTVMDTNGCVATDSIQVESVTGIQELVQGTVQVFPNPTTKFIQLNYELNQSARINFELTNLEGKSIRRIPRQRQSLGKHSERFDLQKFAQGNYLLRMQVGGEWVQWQITKI